MDPELLGAAMSSIGSVTKELGAALSGLTAVTSGLTDTFANTISAAANVLVGPFQALAGAVGPFVQALNPALMMQLGYAMESLKATIGVALTPVVEVLIGAVRQAAGVLMPAMQAMAPVMRTLTQTVIQLLMPAFRAISTIITSMAPIFQLVADMAKEIASGFNALTVFGRSLFETFAEWLKTLMGGKDGMQSFLEKFRDAIHKAVEGLLKLAAYIAKAFGGFDFIRRMRDNLRKIAEGEGSQGGAAPAPQQGGFQSFEPLVKQMAAAAFAAAGGAGGVESKDEKAWLEELSNTLDDIAKNNKTLKEFVYEAIEDWWNNINWPEVARSIKGGAMSIDDAIGTRHGDTLGTIAAVTGTAAFVPLLGGLR